MFDDKPSNFGVCMNILNVCVREFKLTNYFSHKISYGVEGDFSLDIDDHTRDFNDIQKKNMHRHFLRG